VFVISLIWIFPAYGRFHQEVKYCFHWNFSRWDWFTIASAMDDLGTMYWVLLMTLVFSLVAYGFLFSFCYEMSTTEFTSTEEFIERYVAKHAVFIRGVNTEIGTK
jgi:hypothetical protein